MTWQTLLPVWAWATLLGSVLLLTFAVGATAGRRQGRAERNALESRVTRLNTQLAVERQRHIEKLAAMEQARRQLEGTFATLSRRALRENTESFLQLARAHLQQFQVRAEDDLQRREESIQSLVRPIRESLEKTERQIAEIEKERREAFGSLTEHLRQVTEAQNQLQQETRHLVTALRRPEVRGRWGEMTLRRLAELSGMTAHCDFVEQAHQADGDAAMRPDMIVRMPDNRDIIIDAKTPLDGYIDAMEAEDDRHRERCLKRHTRNMRERVRELAGKNYWARFSNTPDFVVLFVPGDQFLAAALERDRAILEDALTQKVVLATPTSLIALLRAIAFGWRQLVVAENVEKVRDLGEELYTRIATFAEHMLRLGKGLNGSIEQYNRAVGSLERQVLPQARRFTDLGIQATKDIAPLNPVERAARLPADG